LNYNLAYLIGQYEKIMFKFTVIIRHDDRIRLDLTGSVID